MTIHILPHNDTALADAWERYKAGECDWSAVQAEQDAMMPRCAAHGTPTATIIDGMPMCDACVAAAGADLRLWLKSLGLIAGGVWTR